MRKQLLSGTALVAAAMLVAGGATAEDKKMMKPSISVNGFAEYVVGGIVESDMDENQSSLDTKADTEIYFNGRATLDSGLKVHAHWQLEGQSNAGKGPSTAGDTIDEYFLSVSGSFGQIILGGTENAASKMITKYAGSWGTGVGESLAFESHKWVSNVSGLGLLHARLSPGSGDEEKISYISPKFNGFQMGLSYIPYEGNEDTNANGNVTESGRSNGLSGALTYGGKIDQVSLGIGLGVLAVPGNTDSDVDREEMIAAAKVSFGPISVAGAYKREETPGAKDIMDLGVRYTQGPNSFSLVGGTITPDEGDANYTAAIASYARQLGPGLKTHINIHWNDSDNGAGATQNGTAASVGMTVSF